MICYLVMTKKLLILGKTELKCFLTNDGDKKGKKKVSLNTVSKLIPHLQVNYKVHRVRSEEAWVLNLPLPLGYWSLDTLLCGSMFVHL